MYKVGVRRKLSPGDGKFVANARVAPHRHRGAQRQEVQDGALGAEARPAIHREGGAEGAEGPQAQRAAPSLRIIGAVLSCLFDECDLNVAQAAKSKIFYEISRRNQGKFPRESEDKYKISK